MNNKKGFIATSLIYSFFLIFITLFLAIIADYLQNKVLLNTIENGIKEEINKGMGCSNFSITDQLVFQGNTFSNYINPNINKDGSVLYEITEITCDGDNGRIKIKNTANSTITYDIYMNNFKFSKEPSDSEYYTITGVIANG